MPIDIAANRRARKWSKREQLGRILWQVAYPLFRFSPRVFWGWRRALLRCFGASIAHHVNIHPTVRIAIPWNLTVGSYAAIGDSVILYNLGRMSIGPGVTISQGAHLCGGTHDYRKTEMPLIKAPIEIGYAAWICADAFIGPSVKVGDLAIVAARAVVMRDVQRLAIVAGNPARVIGRRTEPE